MLMTSSSAPNRLSSAVLCIANVNLAHPATMPIDRRERIADRRVRWIAASARACGRPVVRRATQAGPEPQAQFTHIP
jgi:hypothetical protein